MNLLAPEIYNIIVENMPIMAIDLVVVDGESMLLGNRINKPAQGFFFVPGGRIFKSESFVEALKRVSYNELGVELTMNQCDFLGLFEHFFNDGPINEDISSHYIVLAFKIDMGLLKINKKQFENQHSEMIAMDIDEVTSHDNVHKYTKMYAQILKKNV